MTTKQKLWLGIQLLVFPLATLAPYLLLRIRNLCPVPTTLAEAGQCMNYQYPPEWANLIVLGLMLLLVLLSLVRYAVAKGPGTEVFIRRQAVGVFAVLALTTLAFFLMRLFSQAQGDSIVAGYGGVVGPDGRTIVSLNTEPLFGVGISIKTYAAAAALYLLGWAIDLYRYKWSRRWVGGVKKEELFQ